MKKIIMAVLFATTTTVAAFAGEQLPANGKVLQSFYTLFEKAEKVNWSEVQETDIHHANFEYNGEKLDAYFNTDGEMLATTRYISSKQLPLAASMALREYFAGYEMMPQAIEYTGQGATSYYVTLASSRQDLVIKVDTNGGTSVFKKIKKDK